MTRNSVALASSAERELGKLPSPMIGRMISQLENLKGIRVRGDAAGR